MKSVLILNDGTVLYGNGLGARAVRSGELVFNTSMMGYQEALTDPSYAGQLLLMSYPLIGNYGVNAEEFESDKIHAAGFLVREASPSGEHRQSDKSLDAFLRQYGIPGMEGIDTRFLVRKLRVHGVLPALLATYDGEINPQQLREELAKFDYGQVDFVEKVSRTKPEIFGEGKKTVVLLDYGVKMGIVRQLMVRGVRVVVLPSFSTLADVEEYAPAGVILSNGPGDPAILTHAHAAIRKIAEKNYPLFGICLGHQLLAHAFGGTTFKLKFGHRGSNHAVFDRTIRRVLITTQNHGYSVDSELPPGFEATHINLNDQTIEGMAHSDRPVFSVQYHPESCPGPQDSRYLFDRFIENLEVTP